LSSGKVAIATPLGTTPGNAASSTNKLLKPVQAAATLQQNKAQNIKMTGV
jgi:hypothetical protein